LIEKKAGWSESLQPAFLLNEYYEKFENSAGLGFGVYPVGTGIDIHVFEGLW
jgi:hypothetical protein